MFMLKCMLLTSALAKGQELPTPFFQIGTGDLGPFGNPVEQAIDISVSRRGSTFVNAYDGVLGRQYTAVNGTVQLASGDPLGNTGYVAAPQFLSLALGPDGRPWSRVLGILATDPGTSDFFLMSGSEVIVAPGQPCNAPSLPPGTVYGTPGDIGSRGDSSCVVVGPLLVNGMLRAAAVRVTLDANNSIAAEEVLVLQGQTAPGFQGPIQVLSAADFHGANASQVIGFDPLLTYVFNGSVTIRPGDPSPYPGLIWDSLGSSTVGINGDWAIEGVLSNGVRAIVKNGAPFMREDELPQTILSSINGVRRMVPVHMSSRGRLVWRVEQSLTTPSANAASYFVERKPMAQSWRVQVNGERAILGVAPYGIDRDGVNVGVQGGVLPSAGYFSNFVAAFHLDQSDPACANGESSFGVDPIVSVHGSPWLADGTDFEIMTRRLPVLAFALTLVSSSPSPGAPVTGAIGDLCLGGTIFRSPILRANGLGTTRAWLSDFPIPPGAEPAVGDTWRFQTWYRDVDATSGAPVSRFTEAVEMPFL